MSTKDNPQSEKLLSGFPPATPEAWRAAAEKLLKGAPFEKKLVTRTHEGIDLQPIFTEASRSGGSKDAPDPGLPGSYPYRRGSRAPVQAPHPWLVAQELPYPTYEELHAALKDDLERGQNAVVLSLDRASQLGHDPDQADVSHVGCGGVSIASIAGFGKALDGIDLSQFPLLVEAGTAGPLFLAIAAAHARRKKIPTD
ncbi:MAG: methylmalonyl-CoA mutase, partial [Bacteroidetes bacterium]|nr:methylmalonyl-CoA mutase [Bacteroidota bacterium]